MIKKAGLIIGVALCVFVLGLGIYHTSATETSPKMSADDIEEMVSEQYPGEIDSIKKHKEKRDIIYEVKLKSDAKGYTLKVDGDTGEILKIDEKTIAEKKDSEKEKGKDQQTADSGKDDQKGKQEKEGKDKNNSENNQEVDHSKDKSNENSKDHNNTNDEDNDNNKSEQKEDHSKDEKEGQENKNEDNNGSGKSKESDRQTAIDIKEAMAIGLNEYSGTISEIELDEEDGQLIYELEIISGNVKAEIDINAYTGDIIVIGTESTDGIDADVDSFISIEEAIDAALNEFQGTVVEVELDDDDDGYIYEIEIESDNEEREIEIDAYSGKVVDVDD